MSDIRLIDANALMLDIENEKKNSYCAAEAEAFDIAWDAVYEAPTIDPESLRPTAQWKNERDAVDDPIVWTCTHCKDSFVLYEGTPKENEFNFCPHCGAKMATDMDIEQNFKEISPLEASKIIADPAAAEAGLFWCADENAYVGIDNSTHEAWTEDFSTKQALFNWLKGGED